MKKLFSLLVVLIFSASMYSGIASPAYAAEPVHQDFVSSKENASKAISACVVQDVLYALKGSKIYKFDALHATPEEFFDLSALAGVSTSDHRYLQLVGDGSRLCILHPYTGRVYEVSSQEMTEVVKLDLTDIGAPGRNGRRQVIFSWPVICDGHLYLLSLDPVEYGSLDMYRFSLQDGKAELITPPGVELMEMTSYKEDKLLLRDGNSGRILIFDTAGKQVTDTLTQLPRAAGCAVYDETSDQVYYLDETRLMRQASQPEFLDRVPIGGVSDVRYAALWQGDYVALAGSGLYLCQTTAGEITADDHVLTIWVDSGVVDRQIVNEFRLEYPDAMVDVIRANNGDTLERLTTENLSQNSTIDLFFLPSDLIDYREIFSRGFAAPIRSDKLVANVQQMYPQIREMVLQDQQLLGYPVELVVSYFTVRPDLLEESGLGQIPETLGEYLDMLLQWYELYADEHPGYSFNEYRGIEQQQQYLLQYIITQYVRTYTTDEAPISFDTPVFRSLMEQLASLSMWEDVAEEDENTEQSVFVTKNHVSPFIRILNSDRIGEESILPPVFESGDTPLFSANMMYFIVNPHSEHYDEAIAFLEFYSDHITLPVQYALYPNYNELVEEETYPHRIKAIDDQVMLSKNVIQREKEFLANVGEHYAAHYPEDYTQHLENIATHEAAIAQAEAERLQVEAKRYVCSAESIEEYRYVAAYMGFENAPMVRTMLYTIKADEILMKYMNGVATLDQVLRELDRKIMMMHYEAQ